MLEVLPVTETDNPQLMQLREQITHVRKNHLALLKKYQELSKLPRHEQKVIDSDQIDSDVLGEKDNIDTPNTQEGDVHFPLK